MSTPEKKLSSSPVVGEASAAPPNQESQVSPVDVAGAATATATATATVDKFSNEPYSYRPPELSKFGFRPSESFNFTNPPKPAVIQMTTEITLCCWTVRRRTTIGCVRSEKRFHSDEEIATPEGLYTIIGVFKKNSATPQEIAVSLRSAKDRHSVSYQFHRAVSSLLGYGRFLSLKELGGFGLYKCDARSGIHAQIETDDRTEQILQQLYLSYCNPNDEMEDWADWMVYNLNKGSPDPKDAELSIQLLLTWSVFKIVIMSLSPVVLSLVIGIYYQAIHHDPGTAWVISTYVVAAAAIVIAVLGVATSLGRV